jgi:hypothetical protein
VCPGIHRYVFVYIYVYVHLSECVRAHMHVCAHEERGQWQEFSIH